jgi:hypothetical protein
VLLKLSGIGFSRQQTNAVRSSKSIVRLSPGGHKGIPSPFSAIFPTKVAFCVALVALATILPANQMLGQAAVRTHTELSASAVEDAGRTRASFTAKVESIDSGQPMPTGSVRFMRGAQSIGSAFVDAEGVARLTVEALPAGKQEITAVYEGDDGHLSSSSFPAATAESSGVAGFTLNANPTSLKVLVGGTVTSVITATPQNGFNQAISLSCSGAPYVSVTCVFSPAQVTPGAPTAAAPNGVPALSTLSIQTIAPSGAQLRLPGERSGVETAYAVAIPGVLTLAGLGLSRRRIFGRAARDAAGLLGIALLLVAACAGLTGCNVLYNYNHHGPGYNPGTPVGQYTVTVSGITGTGSSLSTGSVQIALDVTNK